MFTVVWTSWALDKLAEDYVVMDLPGQDRLAAKIDALNHRLAQNPLDEGESRTGNYRVTFVEFLTVRFTVDLEDRVARVYDVRRSGH